MTPVMFLGIFTVAMAVFLFGGLIWLIRDCGLGTGNSSMASIMPPLSPRKLHSPPQVPPDAGEIPTGD